MVCGPQCAAVKGPTGDAFFLPYDRRHCHYGLEAQRSGKSSCSPPLWFGWTAGNSLTQHPGGIHGGGFGLLVPDRDWNSCFPARAPGAYRQDSWVVAGQGGATETQSGLPGEVGQDGSGSPRAKCRVTPKPGREEALGTCNPGTMPRLPGPYLAPPGHRVGDMTTDPAVPAPIPVPPLVPGPVPPSVSGVDEYWSSLLLAKLAVVHAAEADLDAQVAAARAAGLPWLTVAKILTGYHS